MDSTALPRFKPRSQSAHPISISKFRRPVKRSSIPPADCSAVVARKPAGVVKRTSNHRHASGGKHDELVASPLGCLAPLQGVCGNYLVVAADFWCVARRGTLGYAIRRASKI
jgi:hypothetical protein